MGACSFHPTLGSIGVASRLETNKGPCLGLDRMTCEGTLPRAKSHLHDLNTRLQPSIGHFERSKVLGTTAALCSQAPNWLYRVFQP